MITLELSRLDQNTVLFFVFSAIGLIWERRILPLAMVFLGSFLHGSLAAVLFSALVVWHRVDLRASPWIQLKDFVGFFLVMIGAVSLEPFRGFSSFMGVLLISISFGRGLLGTIPALLLFRQYFPQPEQIEIPLIGAGVYWVTAELLRWLKTGHERSVLPFLEAACTLAILFGFHNDILKWSEDSVLVILASSFLFVIAALFSWQRWRGQGFWRTYHRFRESMLSALTFGGGVFTDRVILSEPKDDLTRASFESGMDRVFFVFLGVLIFAGVFILFGRGGGSP